jgi:hypothetical protein
MPRKTRVEFPGAVYHLLDRGDRREPVFRDEGDREVFLATLGQACQRTGWCVIRTRTCVPNKWIAGALALGHVSGIGRYCSKDGPGTQLFRELTHWIENGNSD